MRKLTLTADKDGITLLAFLRNNGFSRRMITTLKNSGGLTVNGVQQRTTFVLSENDIVCAELSEEKTLEPNAALDVPIVYEDEDVIVFDKPWGVATHPSLNHYTDTLGNFFAAHCEGVSFRPLNRLDIDTSGLCLCAKNKYAAANLADKYDKTYFAVCEGVLEGSGEIDAPIARAEESIIIRTVRDDGQPAKTLYSVLSHTDTCTFLRIKLLTGRTHQIRVHFSHIGYPLCGDDMYGGGLDAIQRQALHCGEISFIHPVTKKRIELESDIPRDMKKLLGYSTD